MKRALLFITFAAAGFCEQPLEMSGSAGYLLMGGNPIGYQGYGLNNQPANPVTLGNAPVFTARFTWDASRWLAHEIGASYARNTLAMDFNNIPVLKQSRSVWQAFYDLLLCASAEDAKYRPYIAGGFGWAVFNPREGLPLIGNQMASKFALNYGAGMKIRLSYSWFMRLDYREYVTPNFFALAAKNGWLHQREISAGAGLRF